MTFELLAKLMKEHNIPEDVELMSDSGWECNETEMDGVFYNKEENILIFTQDGSYYDRDWFKKDGWKLIYGFNVKCQNCKHLNEYGYCKVRWLDEDKHCEFDVGIHDTSDCELYEKTN